MKDTLIDWLGTFWKVLIVPTPQTFLAETKKADGKFASSVGWLVFLAIYLYAVASIAVTREPLSIAILLTLALGFPLAVILATSAINFIFQRVFERKKYLYDKILYIIVAVLFPIFFILSPLSIFIPVNLFVLLTYILVFYQVALLTIAIKTIADIQYWQALVCMFLAMIVAILTGFITALLVYATISPTGIINSTSGK